MNIKLRCPSGHTFSVPAEAAGCELPCPRCGLATIVPEPEVSSKRTANRPPAAPAEQSTADSLRRPIPPPLPSQRKAQAQPPRPPSQPAADSEAAGSSSSLPRIVLPPPLPRQRRGQRGRTRAANAYRADRGKLQTVRLLALWLGATAALNLVPAAWTRQLDLSTAPNWARAAMLVAAIEFIYVLWLLATPDWATLQVMAGVFALAAGAYGIAVVAIVVTPAGGTLPLDMGQPQHGAAQWCASMLLLSLLAAYLCARTAVRWRRVFRAQPTARISSRK